MAISASLVKELRERTGLGVLDCRNALVDSDGDMELAIDTLRKASGMKAAKKAGRIASDGLIGMKIAEDGTRGVMVEVNCETDFAARDENFLGFVATVTDQLFTSEEPELSTLLESGLESTRERLVQKIGENCSVRRVEFYEGCVVGYIHNNCKIGVLVTMEGGDESLGRDISMHIAAIAPSVLSPEDVPADVIAKEREIYTAQAKGSGKPPEIIEKIIEGRIKKYLAEISLTEQPFVKDKAIKIGELLNKAGAKINSFVRFEVGEGIDKGDDDFAAEVARQLA